MKHYLSVYRKYISTCFSLSMSFRLNFFLVIIMDLFFYLSSLSAVHIIYEHVAMIGPWDKNQLLFFISFMLAVDHLHMTLLSESFWNLSREIRTGGLDFILLKPIDSIFIVFFRFIRVSSLCNIIVVWFFLIYFGIEVNLSPISWCLLPLLVFLAFILMALLEFIISTSMFWLQEGWGVNFLRMQFQSLARWPDFIYGSISKKVLLTAFPILLVGSGPVHFLFDLKAWQWPLYLIAAIIISFLVLRALWKVALNQYESASS